MEEVGQWPTRHLAQRTGEDTSPPRSEKRQAAFRQEVCCPIVKRGPASSVIRIAVGNIDDHSLPRPREQYAVSVGQVNLAIIVIHILPFRACEAMKRPFAIDRSEVGIPADADPIKLKSLDIELGRGIFQIVRRSNIVLAV